MLYFTAKHMTFLLQCWFSQRFKFAASKAPATRSVSTPFLNNTRLGMLRIWYWLARACSRSVSTLAKRKRVFISAASCANTGAIILQGPHQEAQKSTMTGRSLLLIKRAKLSPPNSIGAPVNTGLPHFPHLGCCPMRSSGTRLVA